jgi:2-polyprenyl-6-methoxyphenol hydroxylase-like FAD-dependent oxidoreductase
VDWRELPGATLSGQSGVRRPDGRWIARTDVGAAIQTRFGLPLLLVQRAGLAAALASQLRDSAIRFGATATGIEPGDAKTSGQVRLAEESIAADLVVAADGGRSMARTALFPAHPGLRYAGYTSWRLLVARGDLAVQPAETWGRHGQRFAVLPLGEDTLYCYATATATARDARGDDAPPGERAELMARFGAWHQPIPDILSRVAPGATIRTDIYEIAEPLPSMHSGRVAFVGDSAHAMTPDLGQGGCQALEDAVVLAAIVNDSTSCEGLRQYTDARLSRTSAVVARSHRAGRLYQAPPWLARNAARLMRLVPATVLARGLDPVAAWRPPGA